jgi:hypothetical protein
MNDKIITPLPCPFCGKVPDDLSFCRTGYGVGGQVYRIRCSDVACFAEGPGAGTVTEAIELWNRRPADKQQSQEESKPVENLPTATNLRIIYAGRNVFCIEGVPGLFVRKKPNPLGNNGEPVKAAMCVGKGLSVKWHLFWRVFDLEARLRNVLAVDRPAPAAAVLPGRRELED